MFWPCLVKCVLAFGWVCSSVCGCCVWYFFGVFNLFGRGLHFLGVFYIFLGVFYIFWACSTFFVRVQHFCPPPPPEPIFPRTAPLQDLPKFHSFFSLTRHIFLSFFPLLGVFSLSFGGVLKAALGPPGFHMTAPELQTCTFEAPALQTQPKFYEKTQKRGKKE